MGTLAQIFSFSIQYELKIQISDANVCPIESENASQVIIILNILVVWVQYTQIVQVVFDAIMVSYKVGDYMYLGMR